MIYWASRGVLWLVSPALLAMTCCLMNFNSKKATSSTSVLITYSLQYRQYTVSEIIWTWIKAINDKTVSWARNWVRIVVLYKKYYSQYFNMSVVQFLHTLKKNFICLYCTLLSNLMLLLMLLFDTEYQMTACSMNLLNSASAPESWWIWLCL